MHEIIDDPPGGPIEGCTPTVTVEGLPTWTDSDEHGVIIVVDGHAPLLWRRRAQVQAAIDRLQDLQQLLTH
jgi:hypothetical protein